MKEAKAKGAPTKAVCRVAYEEISKLDAFINFDALRQQCQRVNCAKGSGEWPYEGFEKELTGN